MKPILTGLIAMVCEGYSKSGVRASSPQKPPLCFRTRCMKEDYNYYVLNDIVGTLSRSM